VRTAERPIVTGAISAVYALLGGLLQVVAGTLLLFFMVNPLTSYLAFLAAFIYVVVYTPLKRISWVNTFIGAVAGALPPLGGWAARTGSLSLEAWLIFTLLYIWQMPHFFSIAWLYRDDYRRASLKMLPAIEEEPIWTKRIISIFLGLLILTSLFPVLRGVSGYIYLLTALIAGGIFLYAGAVFYYRTTKRSAIMLKNASLLYLPLILIGTFLDNLFG
ncbi:MAG: protoheme IX farnesyltransferase, partial [Candidatus Dadabacteria bacterium]